MKLEDSRQFEIGGNTDADDADISITCLRCYRRQFGMAMLRANAAQCTKCQAADRRDARLRRMHAAYHRRSR